ncbi:hypothetical protein [Flaviaesturariibacter amylovorans]|uniref:Photosynthesis system II assembly factor Ycf48/Hcf136-like domain-containing protein n=1 Tax=Flaviaesturariibacter amylovorans TaxID=1084520 RepID=A0ABP8HM77_9BACT
MRRILLTLAVLPVLFASAQLPRLQSYAQRLSVSPAGSVAVVTRAGEVLLAAAPGAPWRPAPPVPQEGPSGIGAPLLESACFFGRDTGFVYGFIHNGNQQNLIYRTVDGGKTWSKHDFGQSGWVDDAASLPNGEAWLSVSGSGFAYTRDHGRTWEPLESPERKQRFTRLFFNTAREGLIGSLWNSLCYTPDGGRTWTWVPTPLDQKKYRKTNPEGRPDIGSVALWGRYYLVRQEGLSFYSRRDSVDWQPLPGCTGFYTDAQNSALFLRQAHGWSVAGPDLATLRTIEGPYAVTDGACYDGSLLLLGSGKLTRMWADGRVADYVPEAVEVRPEYLGTANGQAIGVSGNRIYTSTNDGSDWTYRYTLPFEEKPGGRLQVSPEGRFTYQMPDDSLYYYSPVTGFLRRTHWQAELADFFTAPITRLTLEAGSSGCFHSYRDVVIYEPAADAFEQVDATSSGSKHAPLLARAPGSIDSATVGRLLRALENLGDTTSWLRYSDLELTPKQLEALRAEVRLFRNTVGRGGKISALPFSLPENNIDFDRLERLVDSVPHSDPAFLRAYFQSGPRIISTTSNSRAIRLTNDRGEELLLRNSVYEQDAYLFPWVLHLNGAIHVTSPPAVYRFIKQVYPALLDTKKRPELLRHLLQAHYYKNR